MSSPTFEEEETLRLLLEERGRVHDCKEVGCAVDPNGNAVTPLNPGAQRPKPSQALKDLYKKVKGEPFPEEAEVSPP